MLPMQISITRETQIFLLSCVAGLGLGAIFDCFRVLRAAIRHTNFLVFIEDFIYAVFFGVVYFIFAIAQAGQLRFFIFIGMLLGAFIERILLGNIVVFIVRKISEFIWRFFVSPIADFIAKIALFISSRFVKKCPIFQKKKKINQKVLKV